MTIPLEDQIKEVEREIRMRARLYPEWVEKKRLKPETADHKLAALRAAQSSLVWLEANEHWIRPLALERLRQAKEAAAIANEPAVAALLDAFPGATVTVTTLETAE